MGLHVWLRIVCHPHGPLSALPPREVSAGEAPAVPRERDPEGVAQEPRVGVDAGHE